MKKLKLKENEVVHCATLEEAKKVLKIAHELGLTWNEDNLNKWNLHKGDTCYNFNRGTCISYAEKDFYMHDEDFLCKVITSKEFIKRHKKKNKYKSLEDRIDILEAIVNATNESVTIVKSEGIIEENALRVFEEACKEVQQPKIGDVVKAWDEEESDNFVYGKLEQKSKTYLVSGNWYPNIEKVTEISINDFRK